MTEQHILQLAVQKGHLSQSRLESLRRELPAASRAGRSTTSEWRIVSHLLQSGELAWETVQALLQESGSSQPDPASPPQSLLAGDQTKGNGHNHPRQRYQLEQFLGSGGMGEVYRAFDTQLRRHVALKRLRADHPELRLRFFREARAQARVDHECICKIYDTGEQDDYSFIAMQYIAGPPLNQVAAEIPLEEKVLLLKKAAEGLHAAHSSGVIHRDIKPANILVETAADGSRKPYIVDFGLVRDLNRKSVTAVEDLIGTPHYMSPEQVRGEGDKIDRRSDIYSLGVTLYEILTGAPPFPAASLAEVIMQIVEKEPRPPRQVNPAIPLDLDTIVMKCLEKNPDRRYGSAGELATDLTRFLHGEPIMARRYGLGQRLAKKIRKHKVFSLFMTVALALLVLTVGLWLQARWRSRQQSEIASQFGRDVEEIESVMRYAHLVRPHNIEQDREMVRARITSIGRRLAQLGEPAYGPGHYALGQGYISLRDFAQARKHLELAWDSGFRTPEVSFALGVVLGELYHLELTKAERISDRELREAATKRLEDLYLKQALRQLNAAKPGRDVPLAYAEALIAFYDKRYADALQKIAGQKKQSDRFYEMQILEGNIIQAMGDGQWRRSDYNAAMGEYERAVQSYQVASEIGRSDPNSHLLLGQLYEKMAAIQISSRGQNVPLLLSKAMFACEQALAIDPQLAEAYTTKSAILLDLGRWHYFQGQDPGSHLDRALSEAKKAMAITPDAPYSFYIAGLICMRRGEYELRHGADPIESMRLASLFFQEALALNPNDVSTRLYMSRAMMNMGYYQMLHGMPARENIERAIGSAQEAVERFPDLANVHFILGSALQFKALFEFYRGGSTRNAILSGVKSYQKAIELNPHIPQYYCNCAIALLGQATDETVTGMDPRPTFVAALQVLERARQINPDLPNVYNGIGFIYCEKARYELLHGQDPGASTREAEFNLQKARSLSPNNIETSRYLIISERIRATHALWLNRSPGPFVSRARDRFREGQKINSAFDDLMNETAAVLLTKAKWQLKRGTDIGPPIMEAKELLKRATNIKGDNFVSHRLLGELALLQARNSMALGRNPDPFFLAGEKWLADSLKLNARCADTHLIHAEISYWKSAWQRKQKKGAAETIAQGLAAAGRALEINADHAEAHMIKGLLLQARARMDASKEKSEEDLRLAEACMKTASKINHYLKAPTRPLPD